MQIIKIIVKKYSKLVLHIKNWSRYNLNHSNLAHFLH